MKNTARSSHTHVPYRKLQQHLNRQPVGFPPSASGADIRLLKHIFTPLEAKIATCLSHEPRSLEEIFSRADGLVASESILEDHLTAMVKKGGLELRRERGRDLYANAPLVVGIYELQVNRLTPGFIRDFKAYTSEKRYGISFLSTKRSQMRTVPIHKSITPDLPAADYDQILRLLETAEAPFVVLPCICRKKKDSQGEPCRQTQRVDTCMAMGPMAHTLIKMEVGREIPRADAIKIIRQNQEEGLVLQPSNTRKIDFLCSCCGCCCSMLGLHKELPRPLDFWESGFTAVLDKEKCAGCGKCADTCCTDALSMAPAGGKKQKLPVIDPGRCIGCGHCAAVCKPNAITLIPRPGQAPPPEDRHTLNRLLLENKKHPLAQVKVIGKLAKGMVSKRDLRLLKPGN
ncbi:MAG: 4Fe-4S dicluster domain-containing protein [Desulfobacter sp.]|nr:MAG: 4Fe-4S dicluster domain-containing protein [Desulfobacter sp.]